MTPMSLRMEENNAIIVSFNLSPLLLLTAQFANWTLTASIYQIPHDDIEDSEFEKFVLRLNKVKKVKVRTY